MDGVKRLRSLPWAGPSLRKGRSRRVHHIILRDLILIMTRKRQADKNQGQNAPGLQIPREELLRLVDQTGILEKVPASDHDSEPTPSSLPPRASQENGDDEEYPLAEEVFAATTLLIPMSFLLLMMYM